MCRSAAPLFAFLCILVLAGCADTSFIGKRVDNFTAYYNTYYNAEQSYQEGVDRVLDRRESEPVDMNVYLSLFLSGEGGSNESFATAIEKSADVLREHPNSKWVDESLMLIGKSYYFQQNYVGAEQKFREVQNLSEDLSPEARFWLVRTLVSAGRFGEAERVSASLLTENGSGDGTWTAQTWLARGEAFVRQARWGNAAEALSAGLSGDLPRRLRARSAFLLGQVRETLDDPVGAQAAYTRSFRAANEYEIEYAARLSAIRVRGLNGQPREALAELEDMQEDDKNFERLGALRVLRARLLDAEGKPENARAVLREVLYEPPPAQGATQGRAHYAMAEVYRDAYDDFSRAAAHFDTASTSLRQTVTTREPVLLTPVAITNSESLSRRYRTIADRASDVTRIDSLLRLGSLPPDELRAELEALQQQQAQERAAAQERRDQEEAARRFTNRTVTAQRNTPSQSLATSTGGSFLFHDNPTRVQEGRRNFERRWGPRPRVDNWRRSAAIEQRQGPQAADPDARNDGEVEAEAVADAPPDDAGPVGAGFDLGEIPRTSSEKEALRRDRAVARYELATALFLNAERPDSAATWYRKVIDDDAERPVARRALYALAEVRTAQNRTSEADRLYQTVIDRYPASVFAQRARQRLGLASVETADTTAVAEAAYSAAYQAWQVGLRDSARSAMARVATEHAASGVAPRAVLALASFTVESLRAGTNPPSDTLLAAFLDSEAVDRSTVEDGRTKLRNVLGADAPIDPAAAREDQAQRRPQAAASPPSSGVIQQQGNPRDPSGQETPTARRQNVQQPARVDTADTLDTSDDRMQDVSRMRGDFDTTAVDPAPQVTPEAQTAASRDTTGGSQADADVEADRDPPTSASETPALPDSASRTYDRVLDVLAYLVARYPESPEAVRAQSMGVAIADAYPGLVVTRPDDPAETERVRSDSGTTVPDPDADAPDAAPASRTTPRDSVARESSAPAYRFDVPSDSMRGRGAARERAPAPSPDTTAVDSTASVPPRVPADSSRNGG